MSFEHIILEPEQKELFIRICEAVKLAPTHYRKEIYYEEHTRNGSLVIPANKSGYTEIEDVSQGDLNEYIRKGIMGVHHSSDGRPSYYVTPEGFLYYEWLIKQMGKPVERIENSIMRYLELDRFRLNYADTYRKLKDAEEMLWTAEKEEHFTTIGHLCRESVQDFADSLYKNVMGANYDGPITQTNNRIETLITEKCDSKKVRKFLRALFDYWKAVGGLIQKQEHRAEKEKEQLTWEDARRLVFQTVNVMVELDRALGVKS